MLTRGHGRLAGTARRLLEGWVDRGPDDSTYCTSCAQAYDPDDDEDVPKDLGLCCACYNRMRAKHTAEALAIDDVIAAFRRAT